MTGFQAIVRKFYKKIHAHFPFLFLVFVIIALYSIAYLYFNVPFKRMNYDTFTQIGILRAYAPDWTDTSLFPDIFRTDLRAIFYYRIWSSFQQTTGISYEFTLYLNGVLNCILLFAGFWFYVKIIGLSIKQRFFAFMLIFLSTSPAWAIAEPGGGIYSLADLTIDAFYPQVLGIALMFFILGFIEIAYRKNEEKIPWLLLSILAITFFVTFMSHLFTGLLLLIIVGIRLFAQVITQKKISKMTWAIGITFLSVILVTLVIPTFNWLPYVLSSTNNLQQSPLAKGLADPKYYSIPFRLNILGLSVLGIASLFSRKAPLFLKLWTGVFLLASLSFFFPFKVPYFWRFITFIKIPLSLLLTYEVFNLTKLPQKLIVIVVTFLSLFWTSSALTRYFNMYSDTEYVAFINTFPAGTVIADPIEGNYLQGATAHKVIAIPYGHITSPFILPVNAGRMNLLNDFSLGKHYAYLQVIKEFAPKYLLVNKFTTNYTQEQLLLNVTAKKVYESDKYQLYEFTK